MTRKRTLKVSDFAGDGGPYSEVVVTISIRILDGHVNRSRLGVKIVPDPALEAMAREHYEGEHCGYDENGCFGLSLAENVNGWEDMNDDFPRIDTEIVERFKKECAQNMNRFIERSVRWVLDLHIRAMKEAGLQPRHRSIQ
jgi:hypothetical protein